ncbi:MAG TPA: hypothetical protein VJN96_09580 [Vicinamibacterales bacterium]|nr:hypothetical protein [Vicinamibacterales bacterium]
MLGRSGLSVSPFCLGAVREARTVLEAFDAGINFFIVSLDLHWPVYEATRQGLTHLLRRRGGVRDEIVVAVVSYLDEPLFHFFQVQEFIDAVPRMGRADLLVAGAVSHDLGFMPRMNCLLTARGSRHGGARAIGASFHSMRFAREALERALPDILYCRYGTKFQEPREELFPHLPMKRMCLLYSFKSTYSLASMNPEQISARRLRKEWIPEIPDGYRFALSRPEVDGIMCAPKDSAQLRALFDALNRGPLSDEEQEIMIGLCRE